MKGLWHMIVAHMGVSENSGTPKSSILIGFSIVNHPFWGTPISGSYLFGLHQGCQRFQHTHDTSNFLQFSAQVCRFACPFPWGKNFASGSRMRASKSAAALILGGSKPELQLGFSLETVGED